jgi:hypothetical protein
MKSRKRQVNFRASELTHQQLDQLMAWWGTSQTETLTVLIDRAYQDEVYRQKADNRDEAYKSRRITNDPE